MKNKTRIEAEYSPMYSKIRLFGALGASAKGEVHAIVGLETVLVEEGNSFDPFLELEREEAQHLLESLWRAGVRSHEITSTLGEINATKNHLKDMQKLVFDGRRE